MRARSQGWFRLGIVSIALTAGLGAGVGAAQEHARQRSFDWSLGVTTSEGERRDFALFPQGREIPIPIPGCACRYSPLRFSAMREIRTESVDVVCQCGSTAIGTGSTCFDKPDFIGDHSLLFVDKRDKRWVFSLSCERP